MLSPRTAGMKLVKEATEAAEAKKEKEKEAGERAGTGCFNSAGSRRVGCGEQGAQPLPLRPRATSDCNVASAHRSPGPWFPCVSS